VIGILQEEEEEEVATFRACYVGHPKQIKVLLFCETPRQKT